MRTPDPPPDPPPDPLKGEGPGWRDNFFNFMSDSFNNIPDVMIHFFIVKTQYRNTLRCKKLTSQFIIFGLFFQLMNAPIDLHAKLDSMTIKIKNI
jgi:hypothetical protein